MEQQGRITVISEQELDREGVRRLFYAVLDQGPGVSAGQLEHLFTPFYTSKADGLGLGLSMSRSIVEGFGGELDARPQTRGLLMCCCLPVMVSLNPTRE